MIKYRTVSNEIQMVEVAGETDKQVILPASEGLRSTKENKRSNWSNWHDSWEAAHAFLIKQREHDVEGLRVQLERAKGRLGQIKGMKKPESDVLIAKGREDCEY